VSLTALPIDTVLPELLAALQRHPSAVVRAPTGSGKTTRVAPALLDATHGKVILVEPRRLAARAAARRIAFERSGRVGDEVGYHVRFDRCSGKATRLLIVTPGILLRYLHDDPFLESAQTVIFDEFHERGLESDLALGLVRHVQTQVRPELRILAMSATLDASAVSHYLDDAPVVTAEGRLFPVQIIQKGRPESQALSEAVGRAVEELLAGTSGDILVFLPGWSEIREAARQLERIAKLENLLIVALHGDLPAEEQDRALLPQAQRKIVLATNVAETSVTVEGVTGVVDSGLARQLRYDPALGLDRLELLPISRASADQRAGRAGRTQPGVCIRLWSELQQQARAAQTEPEIHRVDLTGAVLQLLALGERDLSSFPWLEAPRQAALDQSLQLLGRLSAVTNGNLTETGNTLARLPAPPRLGRLLIEGHRFGVVRSAAMAAALLTERDPFVRPAGSKRSSSDLLERIEALTEFERAGNDRSNLGTIHRGAASYLFRVRDQLTRSIEEELGPVDPMQGDAHERLLRALIAAFPDRVARRREPGSNRGVMVGGRGVRLADAASVGDSELFLCLDVDAGEGESWVRQATPIRRDWLPLGQVVTKAELAFDFTTERVAARQVTRFEDLVLDETPMHLPANAEVERVLIDAAAARLDRVLPADDSVAGSLLSRVRWLRGFMPELGLPAFDSAELAEMLPWLGSGCKSFADLRKADWLGMLQSKLTRQQLHTVDREAPERLEAPSGNKIALKYEQGRPPVLAVRIQELFGWTETPRLAAGRVKVLLHLLAPNFRPQQVTDDLASFWKYTYPQVRKDLRARYPKHAWPEDPLTAEARRGGRGRAH